MLGDGLNRYRDAGLLVLRVGLGACFVGHGWPKLAGGPSMWAGLGGAMGNFGIHFAPAAWGFVGAAIEVFGGLLFALGFLFRPVCVLLVGQMIVAMTYHLHAQVPYARAFATGWSHPLEDGVVFLAMIIVGPGRYSVDEGISRGVAEAEHRPIVGVTPQA